MITLILLASGFGKRFGSNKLLYKIQGKAMYLHILERLHCLSSYTICGMKIQIVVVSQYEEILSSARDFGMEAIFNDQAREGIAASVRYGVEAAKEAEWFAFFTADQPYLREDTIESFLQESIKQACLDQGKTMASVYHGNNPGNPTLFHKTWKEDLKNLHGDKGGRKIMKKHPDQVFWYEISPKEIKDIDYS